MESDYDANGNAIKLTSIGGDASPRDGYRFYDEPNRLVRAVGPLAAVHGGASQRLQTRNADSKWKLSNRI